MAESKTSEKTSPLKPNSNDVFHVLSPEQLEQTWLVISPPNPNAKHQKHKLFILTPNCWVPIIILFRGMLVFDK